MKIQVVKDKISFLTLGAPRLAVYVNFEVSCHPTPPHLTSPAPPQAAVGVRVCDLQDMAVSFCLKENLATRAKTNSCYGCSGSLS